MDFELHFPMYVIVRDGLRLCLNNIIRASSISIVRSFLFQDNVTTKFEHRSGFN